MLALLAGADGFNERDAMRIVEDKSCSFEINAVLSLVAPTLRFIPLKSDHAYLHCRTYKSMGQELCDSTCGMPLGRAWKHLGRQGAHNLECRKNDFPCILCMCVYTHTYMSESPEQVIRWFQAAVKNLSPAAAGSLSLRRSPCIRNNCPACASGQGHSSYVLYGRLEGKRFSIYVPDDLVPQINEAIANGRRLQELVSEAGVRYTQALKARRRKQLGTMRRRPSERVTEC